MSGCIQIEPSGTKIVQLVRVKNKVPATPLQMQNRIRLLCMGIELAKIEDPQNAMWKSSNSGVWTDHMDYILGLEVSDTEITSMDKK